jgi:hypothetical protein
MFYDPQGFQNFKFNYCLKYVINFFETNLIF